MEEHKNAHDLVLLPAMRALLEHTADPLFIKDVHSVYVGVSMSYASLLGRSPESVVGMTDLELFGDPSLAARYIELDGLVFSTGEAQEGIHMPALPRDGKPWFVKSSLYPIRDDAGAVVGLYGIFHSFISDYEMERNALVRAAETDSMTGLLNHDAAIRHIEQYIQEATPKAYGALFMIDLDNFKLINDTFGHKYGDQVLVNVSGILRKLFRETDVLGRLGGDEFMVLMKGRFTLPELRRKGTELLQSLQFSCGTGDQELPLSVSAGVTLCPPEGANFGSLYSQADAALYQAKGSGKNRFHIFASADPAVAVEAASADNASTIQYRTLLEHMDGGVIVAEVSEDKISITYASPSIYRSMHPREAELGFFGDKLFALVDPRDLADLRRVFFETAKTGKLLNFSYRVLIAGSVAWRHIRTARLPREDYGPGGIRRLIAIITDITEMKTASAQLSLAEETYKIAIRQTGIMIFKVDLRARTLHLSGDFTRTLGRREGVTLDVPEGVLAEGHIHDDSVAEYRRMFANLYAGKDDESYHIRYRGRDGQGVWSEVRFEILRDESGTPYYAVGTVDLRPNIDADMQRFEQEKQLSELLRDSLQGATRANLSQNRLEYIRETDGTHVDPIPWATYDKFHDASDVYVVPDDLPRFLALSDREYLLGLYRSGESWQFIEYRRRKQNGLEFWMSMGIRLLRHPVTGEVYAFAYIRDNEERHQWEATLGMPPQRDTAMLLYTRETMEQIAANILSDCQAKGGSRTVALTVTELTGIDKVREEKGLGEVSNILLTVGRLYRILLDSDVLLGRLDETHVVMLRTGAGSVDIHRARVIKHLDRIRRMLEIIIPDSGVDLICGFALESAGSADFETLLRKASTACVGAAELRGQPIAAYSETGVPPPENVARTELETRYRDLTIRYQQLANLLRLSDYDELTGLPLKLAFYRKVRERLDAQPGRRYVIVRMDINRFKLFNDVFGPRIGDQLLRSVGETLRDQTSQESICGRIESDHFAICMPESLFDPEKLYNSIAAWTDAYSSEFKLSSSIGVYVIEDPSLEVALMCDRALLALQTVKGSYTTRIAFFDELLREKLLSDQQLVADMSAGLENREFEVYFQPQINYADGSLLGAEALVRWNHPTRGFLTPASFIPLFEANGFVLALDHYVWDETCRYLRRWKDAGLQTSVSINISRVDIYDPKLCETLKELVDKYELSMTDLKLEITESAYMETPEQLIAVVVKLRNMGFTVEMDDFGSGYSSLNTLKDVPVDILKLDVRFLSDSEDNSRGGNILSSVIRMARWLKLPVVAEGVETSQQADYLNSLGCAYMQGYFFSRPVKATDFELMLAERRQSDMDRYRDTNIEGMAAFWDASAQTALLFNSYVGGAAIMEYRNGNLEALRVNDNYYKTIGTTREAYTPVQTRILDRFDAENRARFVTELEKAIATREETGCELQALPGSGGVTRFWTQNRLRMLAQSDDSYLFYVTIEDITERKTLEMQLQAEKQKTDLALSATSISLWTYDLVADTFIMDSKGTAFHGINEVVDESWRTVIERGEIMPDSVEDYINLHQVLKTGVKTYSSIIHFDAAFATAEWMRITYSVIFDGEGMPILAAAVGEDVTAQMEAEQRYKVEEEFRRNLGSDYLLSIRINANWDIIEDVMEPPDGADVQLYEGMDCGHAAKVLSQSIPDEGERKAFLAFFMADNLLDAHERGDNQISILFRETPLSGGLRWVETVARLTVNPSSGELTAFVTMRDRSQEMLMNHIVKSIIDTGYDYIAYIEGETGRYRLVTAQAGDQTLLPEEGNDFANTADIVLRRNALPGEAERLARDASLSRVMEELDKNPEYVISYQTLMPNGLRMRRLVYRYLDRESKQIILTRQDVTELLAGEQRRNEALAGALAEVRRADMVKSEFLANVSHDIRLPMNAILWLTTLAREEPSNPPETVEYLNKIEASSHRMLTLLGNILDMSRLEAQTVTLNPRPLGMDDFWYTMEALVRPMCEEKQLRFELEAGALPDVVFADRARLQQVFYNLLYNAVKFTSPGGFVRCAQQNVSAAEDAVRVDYLVEDNGIGMEESFVACAFEPFARERRDDDGDVAGTGLGLSIAKALTEMMGGAIRLESEPGRGTRITVSLRLPIAKAPQAAPPDSAETPVPLPAKGAYARRVLLADDNSLSLDLTSRMLAKRNIETVCTKNGQAALDCFIAAPPGHFRCVLLDIRMPVLDGLEAAKAIRALDREDAKTIPIIAMSANAFVEDVEKSLAAGMNLHLAKPVDPDLLYETVERCM